MAIRPFQVTIDDLTLRGVAHLPGGSGPHPTAVLHHGFGSQRTEASRLFVQLSRALNDVGIAAVAGDRAGHGESDGEFFGTTVTRDVRHAHRVLEAVARIDEVDGDDLHLLGMSLGGVVASVVAAETDLPVRSLTLWCPAAVFVDEIRGGTLQGRSLDVVPRQGYFDFNGMRLGPDFLADAVDFDVYGRARGFGGQVRLLHGADDAIVPVRYAQAYADVYGAALVSTVVPGADHLWSGVPLRDLLVAETVHFVSGHSGVPAR